MNTSLRELPVEQRIQLVEELWDSIAADQQTLPLTKAHREELDRRLDAFDADGDTGQDAKSVLSRIRRKL